ncbi:alpha/beta hydrolase [Arenimonas oryziterrae]|uniref:Serine aminopeptidase S33 domain-containing protein n=1 Tax=Arenimonas oryziterrae DSM 21050 = YC6267 TaxID=1121015 RepID=A0A091AT90_9GAMM|nr:alpha/beta hydrolase [Arenimonas oryziterrae]KFN42566.1 hypothetical protein N789_13075 [Arenimonas oryziterrae DSM 21050 = YC6267]
MHDTLRTRDNLTLHLEQWPAGGERRGTVLIVHGLGEHIGRYAGLAAVLNAQGWNVVGYDQRGHGRSTGPKGRLRQADDLLQDLAQVIDHVRATAPAPLILLGHSMGGLICARFVAEEFAEDRASWYRAVSALVLSSPALDPGMSRLQRGLLALLGPLAPNLPVNNGLKPAWISRDPTVVQAYRSDPYVHDRISPRLVRFILDGGAWVQAQATQWRLPTLLLYAGSDRCVSPAGSAAFSAAAPAAVVQTQVFPAMFHEIFNEPERDTVIAALTRWLDTRA